MSKSTYGGPRTKNAHENYIERLSYGQGLTTYTDKKRKPFTHINTPNDNELAYRSTPDYLRQLTQQNSISSDEMILARNVPRTKSASELTPRNNLNRSTSGNPKYKAQEDYYDDIQLLKKEMKTTKDENSNLRAKVRRLEEDNTRKRKEIDTLYDTNKDGDLRRTLTGSTTDRNNNNIPVANVVMSLKQRVFKLELQLKQKETTIEEMKSDPRWTKNTEFEIQNRALFGEVERQKVERLNYLQQNDYMASIDEEVKNAVRKLENDKKDLKEENESMKKKIKELEKSERSEPSSARQPDASDNSELHKEIKDLKQNCRNYENQVEQINAELKQLKVDRDKFRDKFDQANEEVQKLKRDRDQYHQKLDQANKDLEDMRSERDRQGKPNQSGRSSPVIKRDGEQDAINLSSTRLKRPQSPLTEKRPAQSSTSPDSKLRTDSYSSGTKLDRHSPLSSPKASAKNIRENVSTSENADRVKNFREKHAATVIQRGWRRHEKSRKDPLRDANKTKSENFDKRRSQIGTTMEPSETKAASRSSPNILNLSSGSIKSRPSSANTSNESSLKTVQASLRGYINRNEMDKSRTETSSPPLRPQTPPSRSRTPPSTGKFKPIESDDDDIVVTPSRQSASEKKRDDFPDQIKSNSKQSLPNDKIGSNSRLPLNNRDSNFKIRGSTSPPPDSQQPSSAFVSSKRTLPSDRTKLGFGSRLPSTDPEPRRSPTPSAVGQRPSSPNMSSKPNLLNDSTKFGANNRESPPKQQRPSSPANVRRPFSPDNSLPLSKKSPTNSKQSIQATQNDHDDDDDVEAF